MSTTTTDDQSRRPDQTATIAVVGLVAALLIALIGYIILLGMGQATGTLDNIVSLAIGAVAGGTVVGGAQMVRRRKTDDDDAVEEVTPPFPGQPPAFNPFTITQTYDDLEKR